jgi:hypothetical protein
VWVYLQFWLVLPLCFRFIRRFDRIHWLIFIAISVAADITFSLTNTPLWVYRLLAIRYIFLMPLGRYWATHKIRLNSTTLTLSAISVISIIALEYTDIDFSPVFFNSWRMFKWLCYFYPAMLLMWALCIAYHKVNHKIRNLFTAMGRCSYEIFLMQMLVFALYPHSIAENIIGNRVIAGVIFIVLTITLSIAPCLFWQKRKEQQYDKA